MLATVSPQVRHFNYFFATSVSFYQLSHPTCVILATLSPHQSPQHTHNILQLPLLQPFFQHLQSFSLFFWKNASCLCGDHIFASQPGAFCLQNPTFWTLRRRQQQRCWQLFRPKCIILATFSAQMCPFGDFSVPKCLMLAPFPSNIRHLGDFSTQEAPLRRPSRKQVHHFGNFFIHNASFGKLFSENPLLFN